MSNGDDLKKEIKKSLERIWKDKGLKVYKDKDVEIVARPIMMDPTEGGGITFDIKIKGVID